MASIRRHVRKILAASKIGEQPDVKVFPGWLDFEVAQQDPTWTEIISELCKHETVLGVHENSVGMRQGSFVVLEDSLILFLPNDSKIRIAFRDIVSWDRLYKQPPSSSVWIVTSSRATVHPHGTI